MSPNTGYEHFALVLAKLARRHPRLQVHTAYSDRFVDLFGEGFNAGIRVDYLCDFNLLARRTHPCRGDSWPAPPTSLRKGEPKSFLAKSVNGRDEAT